ncbi:cytochrome c1 [Hyphomicrobiales bacterium]|nr:cytochrome c1 [Hyphomicrobiales bacterium]
MCKSINLSKIRQLILSLLGIFFLITSSSTFSIAAGEGVSKVKEQDWTFSGVFGYYDRGELQRGFQVYKEVCSSCHSMKYVYYRNLSEPGGPGFSVDEAKAIAAEFTVVDGPDASGDMFERNAVPSDKFVSPYDNDAMARMSNGGALPPDLSLIAKARSTERGFPLWIIDLFTGYQEQGVDYVYALLNGYKDMPSDFPLQDGMNYNKYYPGNQIAMYNPLSSDIVEYADGTEATVENMSKDVATFLMWTAEPKLEARKKMGFKVIIFLSLLAGLLYFSKKKIWARLDH